MPRNPGCWANVLNDCHGPLTGEHTLSVSVWSGVGERQNRASRLRRPVTLTTATGTKQTTVRHLTRDILCEFHNNTSNHLDTQAGVFSRALNDFVITDEQRGIYPQMRWAPRIFNIDGPLLERWFIKAVINAEFGTDMPIGDANGTPGWPTRELVEIVFGRRPVTNPVGLFAVVAVGANHEVAEEFRFIPFDRNGTHMAGSLLLFKSFHFGVSLEAVEVRDEFFRELPDLGVGQVLQPLRAMNSGGNTNLAIRFNWPA